MYFSLAGGGILMLVLVGLGAPSSFAITGPMAIYALGVGLTMPQAMASARTSPNGSPACTGYNKA